ncbi:unnamed protein product [Scytosiphon promiscuus]
MCVRFVLSQQQPLFYTPLPAKFLCGGTRNPEFMLRMHAVVYAGDQAERQIVTRRIRAKMPPFVTPLTTMRDTAGAATAVGTSAGPSSASTNAAAAAAAAANKQSRFVHQFNDIGGRPEERFGTRGSFTHGIRVMSGGPARDVPLEAEIDHGKVLFTCSTLKPDLSGESRTNVVGGRPTERLGLRGGFTPGTNKTFLGGVPRDVPLEAEIDHGKVLFTCSALKPDRSGEARTNVAGGRPTERLGLRGGFTPGIHKTFLGGVPRDVPPKAEIDHGKVLFASSAIKPDLSCLPTFNVAGGRPDERFGTRGSFTPGVRIMAGGPARDMPFQTADSPTNPGKVLFVSPALKPDLSGELRANVAGGRPTERLGGHPGRFTPGARCWLGGEPRDVPAGRETTDHGKVLFVSSVNEPNLLTFLHDEKAVGSSPAVASACGGNLIDNGNDTGGDGRMLLEGGDAVTGECRRVQGSTGMVGEKGMGRANGHSCNDLVKGNNGGDGVFRRCGSDSQFNNTETLFSLTGSSCRPSF